MVINNFLFPLCVMSFQGIDYHDSPQLKILDPYIHPVNNYLYTILFYILLSNEKDFLLRSLFIPPTSPQSGFKKRGVFCNSSLNFQLTKYFFTVFINIYVSQSNTQHVTMLSSKLKFEISSWKITSLHFSLIYL